MTSHWNWQQPQWPQFTYDFNALEGLEASFSRKAGILIGAMTHLPDDESKTLTVELMRDEAMKTSEIEGEYLDRESVQSSIRRQFGLEASATQIPAAEQGIAEMMVDLYRSFHTDLTHERLCQWHTQLVKGRGDLKDVGRYRNDLAPMQMISGPFHRPRIHFEAPPSREMRREMDRFIAWFNRTAPCGTEPLPALIRASITHLYFVSIHPFEDGNGRIGRALAEKALSQCLGRPTLIAQAQTIEAKKQAYYSALEENNRSLEITPWLLYSAHTILEALDTTQSRLAFVIEKTKFYHRLRGHLNPRQEKGISRMFREGITGFQGGLSATNYIQITKTSRATATRDLQDLVAKGALRQTGQRKHRRYYLNIAMPSHAKSTH